MSGCYGNTSMCSVRLTPCLFTPPPPNVTLHCTQPTPSHRHQASQCICNGLSSSEVGRPGARSVLQLKDNCSSFTRYGNCQNCIINLNPTLWSTLSFICKVLDGGGRGVIILLLLFTMFLQLEHPTTCHQRESMRMATTSSQTSGRWDAYFMRLTRPQYSLACNFRFFPQF